MTMALIAVPLLLAALGAAPAGAADSTATAARAAREDSLAAPEMITYYLGFLKRGPKWTPERTPAIAELQRAHLAHMTRMHEAGKLIVAGPITDGGDLRGIVVYQVGSIDEARAATEADPMVKAGRLAIEFHPWMVEKGVLPEPKRPR